MKDKIAEYDKIEIHINGKLEMEFEGIIDPPYIKLHYDRIVKAGRHFDMIKMIGYNGTKSKELISEVIVEKY